MRFTEWENPETEDLEWLIRNYGCMYCTELIRTKNLKSHGYDMAGPYDPPV